jgi:hypothetical protein
MCIRATAKCPKTTRKSAGRLADDPEKNVLHFCAGSLDEAYRLLEICGGLPSIADIS